jgi:hypothetical protein
MEEDAAAAAAARAARTAAQTGAIDWLQAEALEALAQSPDDAGHAAAARATLGGELTKATRAMLAATEAATARLEDDDAATEIEELAVVLARLQDGVRRLADRAYDAARPQPQGDLYASPRWQAEIASARRQLRQAADLLDDGEPADAVALQVLTARDRLRRALGG